MTPAPRVRAGGSDRVLALVRKLQKLIHLAEVDRRRDEARRQVRLAAAEAPAPSGGTAESPAEGGGGGADIDALAREVLEAVNREFELRQERRLEESDERDIWW